MPRGPRYQSKRTAAKTRTDTQKPPESRRSLAGERLQLGKRLAEIRQRNGWTLEAMSKATGVAISTLSKVENQQASMSFDTLVKLCEGLGLSFQEFVNPEGPTFAPGRRAVTRAGEGEKFSTEQYDYEVHSSELSKKKAIPLVMRIRSRDLAEFDRLSSHEGEEFIYVLKGAVILHTEYYAPVFLSEGDSAYIDSAMGHGFVSASEEDAMILSLCIGNGSQAINAFPFSRS